MKSMSAPEAGAEPRPRVGRPAARRYRRVVVLKVVGGAASALGAGAVSLLFWWLKSLG